MCGLDLLHVFFLRYVPSPCRVFQDFKCMLHIGRIWNRFFWRNYTWFLSLSRDYLQTYRKICLFPLFSFYNNACFSCICFSNHVQVVCRVICRWFVHSFRFCVSRPFYRWPLTFRALRFSFLFFSQRAAGFIVFHLMLSSASLCIVHCTRLLNRPRWLALHIQVPASAGDCFVTAWRPTYLCRGDDDLQCPWFKSLNDFFVFHIYAFTGTLIQIVTTIMSKSQCKLKYGTEFRSLSVSWTIEMLFRYFINTLRFLISDSHASRADSAHVLYRQVLNTLLAADHSSLEKDSLCCRVWMTIY